MNNTFDFKRFGQVVAKDWRLYIQKYGITLTVFVSLPILLWITSLVLNTEIGEYIRGIIIILIVAIATMLVPAHVYGKTNLPREGVSFAMLPATSTEKFLSMTLYCSIITPILCGLGCLAMDCLMTLLPGGFEETIEFPDYIGRLIFLFLMIYITESSLFMLGNMIFKKRKTGKTFAWILLILFVITMIVQIPFLMDALDYIVIHVESSYWLSIVIMLALSTLFNCLTYRRIKKQTY